MKRLLESYIQEVLKEKSCGCSEGESCDECGPAEVDEISSVGGVGGSPPSITGVITPLGAGSRGKVKYADPKTKDSPIEGPSKHLKKSNKKRKTKK